jgi:dihydropyrimidinase
MSGLVIRNGELVTSNDRWVADIYCEGGKIAAVGAGLEVPAGTQVLDASGQLVLPGGVDAHTHMELPFMGTVSADDFFTGTAAGVAGGTTTIIDFIIPNRNQSLLDARNFWMENARKACADYAFHMAVTWYSETVEREMRTVYREDGISSFKTFMAYTGAIGVDDRELIQVMRVAKELGALVTCHCEHGEAVVAMQKALVAQGKLEPRHHAASRPSWVEGEATHRAIQLARIQGQPIYIVHLTCKESMDAAIEARRRGQLVYVETCPQYLLLDDSVYEKPDFEGAAYVMSPPIRPKGHQDVLWAGLQAGLVHAVATDHCPFRQSDQKTMGRQDFTKIPNGAAGIEDRIALMYTHGVAAGRISLQQLVDACCTRPAKIFNLYPRKGSLLVGGDADILVYDPTARRRISAKTHHQRVDRNIYEGFEVQGRVTHTLVGGKLGWVDGDLRVERGAGRYLRRA